MLRLGRNNTRALDGPMKLPRGGELLDKVTEIHDLWFNIWINSYVPKIMFQPKWWKQDKDLYISRKKESAMDSAWSLGAVEQVVEGPDGVARRVIVKYQNANEGFKRDTDRSIRSLVKLWSLDDQNIDDDLEELRKKLERSEEACQAFIQLKKNKSGQMDALPVKKIECAECCCRSHCLFSHESVDQEEDVKIQKLLSREPFEYEASIQLDANSANLDHDTDLDQKEIDDSKACSTCSLTSIMQDLSLNLYDDPHV